MYKKNKSKNSNFYIMFLFLSSIFFVSFCLNFIFIFIIFLGYFLHINYDKKTYIKKILNNDDVIDYLIKYNKKNKTNFIFEDLNIKEKKYDFPEIVFFSFHASHECILNESNIKITDRMIHYYKNYSNVKIYAINYYSNLFFPTEKGIKKNAINIVQKIINNEMNDKIFYQIGFDSWSLGTCVALHTINNIKLKDNISMKFIDLRTPPLNLMNIAYQAVNLFIYTLYPIIFIFGYEDFFNNQKQIKILLLKYSYIDIHFFIPEDDKIVNIQEQNKLFKIVNYNYIRNITQFTKGTTHNDDHIVYGLQYEI